jgi:hypothetical protein
VPVPAGLLPLRVQSGFDVVSGGSSADDGAQCITRLSREQVSAAAALLADLEATVLYRLVRRAVEEQSAKAAKAGASAASRATGSSSSSSSSQHQSSDPHSALMAASHDHAGDLAADHTLDVPEDAAGGTVATLASSSRSSPASASSSSSSSSSSAAASCGHQAMTCVRVHTAHVVTMLLLTLYASEGRDIAAVAATAAAAAASGATGPATASDALRRLAAASLDTASPLVRSEVSLLRGQMDLEMELARASGAASTA